MTRSSDPSFGRTGNGEWIYEVLSGWGELPKGIAFGGTHGGIACDNAGHVYVCTQSATGVIVYDSSGKFIQSIAHDFPEIHSIVHSAEGDNEYFYCTVLAGTPRDNCLLIKMTTDGRVVQRITAPQEAGFQAPDEWRLTAAVVDQQGSIYAANGYGDSRMFKFDKSGNYVKSFSRLGAADGECNCCHGLAIDIRYDQPLLLVCDRENLRLSHFDLDGRFVGHIANQLRRPCQVSFWGDYIVVSELLGRATILDRNNTPISFLGDNPQRAQWANYDLDPESIPINMFSAPHGCYIDKESNIYISDWNRSGRVTKLVRVRPM